MIIKCAWCGKTTGEKEPLEDKSITHGICEECLIKNFPHIAERIAEVEKQEEGNPGGQSYFIFAYDNWGTGVQYDRASSKTEALRLLAEAKRQWRLDKTRMPGQRTFPFNPADLDFIAIWEAHPDDPYKPNTEIDPIAKWEPYPIKFTEPAGGSSSNPKEPWQMTREEYVKSAREWRAENMPRLTGRALEDELEHVAAGHKLIVQNAMGLGKPVPPEVLADYPELRTREGNPPGEEIPRKELNKFALKLVAGLRGQAEGLVSSPQYKDWTEEELQGTADLILKDLRENNKEAIEALQKLYQETGGEPFKEEHYAG